MRQAVVGPRGLLPGTGLFPSLSATRMTPVAGRPNEHSPLTAPEGGRDGPPSRFDAHRAPPRRSIPVRTPLYSRPMTDPPSGSRHPVTQTWGGTVARADGTMPELPNRWAPVRLLGEGGQAEVWLAEDLELGEPVAIKLFRAELSPSSRERLRREVRLGRALQHHGLVRIFELIEAGDRLAIVMEWVPGGSLGERAQSGPLPIPEVVDTARQTLEALSVLHAQQVLHRDIKPSNLLLDADGRVKLADLGLARSLSEASDVTRTQTAVGTPAYMSPEQLAGREPQAASDLFALGATLFELTTGQRPFASPLDGSGEPRLTARAGSPRHRRPDCPRWLASFILRLLEREPRDRFPDAARALAAFERRHLLVSPRLRRRLAAGVLAACCAAAAGLAVWNRSRSTLSTVTVSGSQVVAIDQRGRELWRREFPGTSPEARTADVVADGKPEVVIALQRLTTGLPEREPNLFVLSSSGEQLGAVPGSMGHFSEYYPGLSPVVGGTTTTLCDLDGDQRPDLTWRTLHAPWYPSVVGQWPMRAGQPPSTLLVNSGTVLTITSADLTGDGRPRLVLSGVNNPLGYQYFVAILDPVAPMESRTSFSPDLVAAVAQAQFREPYRYTLLGPHPNQIPSVAAGRDGIVLSFPHRTIELDRDGLPRSTTGSGAGWPAHRKLWQELATTCVRIESGQDSALTPYVELAAVHGEVLAEPPIHLAAVLLLARSLARAVHHADAASLLDQQTQALPDEIDLWLRLGEQLAILGHREDALRALERATAKAPEGRRPLDALMGRVLLAGTLGDEQAVADAVRVWHAWYPSGADHVTGELRALWAFSRGQWAAGELQPSSADTVVPAMRPLRLWAAWERGDHAERIWTDAQNLTPDPETTDLARLLLARMATSTGSQGEAIDLAQRALLNLERNGRESWEIFAWVPLAERVLGDALTAAGRPAEAAPHLARARRLAPGAWFGQTEVPTRRPPDARRDRPT